MIDPTGARPPTLAERRNPLLVLPSVRALHGLDDATRELLAGLLFELRADALRRADLSWRTRKPPMAAYWAAVAVYAGHLARCLRRERRKEGKGHPAGVRYDH